MDVGIGRVSSRRSRPRRWRETATTRSVAAKVRRIMAETASMKTHPLWRRMFKILRRVFSWWRR